MKKELVIIVDPLSTGELLYQTIVQRGFDVICIFTLKKETVQDILENLEAMEKKALNCIYTNDVDEVIRKLDLSNHYLKAIIPGSEPGVELVGQLSEIYKTNFNPKSLTIIARNKAKLKSSLENKGLLNTKYKKCHTIWDIDQFIQKGHFPFVIKNPSGAGQNQVFICHSIEELYKGFETIISQQNLFGLSSNYALLEEYIGGKEYAVNLFADGSHIFLTDIWEYERINTNYAENLYYNAIEVSYKRETLCGIVDYAIQICKNLDLRRGPVHVEVKDDPIKGPVLIDFGLRHYGLKLPILCKQFSNFAPFKSTLDVFVHGKINVKTPVKFKKHVAVAFVPVEQTGKVEKINGLNYIQQLPSYFSHRLKIKPGNNIKPTKELGDTPFYVFLAHSSRQQLMWDIADVHNSFEIVCHQEADLLLLNVRNR
ncbi:MAG: ATP-grasp domain-containing protein [Saprospiraceae bacterium]|nr:MAG: ATP-grasp domain-containing protein [Saprospiraceae bacterium]